MSFASLDKNAPTIPGNTCPLIDRAVKVIDDASNALSDLSHHKGELEKIRTANEELREVGIFWREAAKELCERIEELESDLADMTAKRDALQDELNQQEDQRDAA